MSDPKYTWCAIAVDSDWESAAVAVEAACQKLEDAGVEIFAVNGPAIDVTNSRMVSGPDVHFVVIGRTPAPTRRSGSLDDLKDRGGQL